jgi:hypothetical protein
MGMALVAPFAANPGGSPVTTIKSTLRRTNSAARSGSRSSFCSANRYSMVIFFPSNPSKLAHFLPEWIDEDRHAGSSTSIQETYAEHFRWLLRFG